jgi:hypothetical protein
MQNNQQINTNQSPPLPPDEARLKIVLHQYETLVGLYKHHLDLVLKVNIFTYAITGAILSFYFSFQQNNKLIAYSLIFPLIMNTIYAAYFFFASTKIHAFIADIKAIHAALNLIAYPDMNFLRYALIISAVLYACTAIGLLLITACNICTK